LPLHYWKNDSDATMLYRQNNLQLDPDVDLDLDLQEQYGPWKPWSRSEQGGQKQYWFPGEKHRYVAVSKLGMMLNSMRWDERMNEKEWTDALFNEALDATFAPLLRSRFLGQLVNVARLLTAMKYPFSLWHQEASGGERDSCTKKTSRELRKHSRVSSAKHVEWR